MNKGIYFILFLSTVFILKTIKNIVFFSIGSEKDRITPSLLPFNNLAKSDNL